MNKNENNKIVIISRFESIFHKELSNRLRKNGLIVKRLIILNNYLAKRETSDTIVIYPLSKRKIIHSLISTFKLIKTLKAFSNEYDILNVHFVAQFFEKILPILNQLKIFNNQKLILTFYGSDFFKISSKKKKKLEKVIRIADKITFTNQSMLEAFDKFYEGKYSDKLCVVRFGLDNLEAIKQVEQNFTEKEIKEEFRIPKNKIVITCGYNAIPEQNHEKIIRELKKLPKNIKNKIFLIFPMTYGGNVKERVYKVNNEMKDTDLEYKIIDKYLESKEVAKLRIASDIMINLRDTDQFSGSMQEYIFAGNYIITGTWLPYDILIEKGVDLIRINDFNELNEKLIEVIKKIESGKIDCERIRRNKEIIWELSSWEKNIDKWIELYTSF